MRPNRSFIVAALVGGLAIFAGHAKAQEIDRLHGRISFAAEDGLIKGSEDDEWSYATINSLILPGDTVWADNEGVLEMEFSGGTFVRLADGSRVDVVSLPPNAVFRGWSGSFYIQRTRRSSGVAIFETPVGRIHVQPNTQVRVDVLTDGPTTVTVRWGQVQVEVSGSEPIPVNEGLRTYVDPGYLPSRPEAFDRGLEDSFDAWNRERARLLAIGSENIPVIDGSHEAPIGTADLNAYGEWIYVDDSYYWRPTVVREYVPYRTGHWSYVPSYGYTWIGHYPFSYVTSHYGYWDYHRHHGWIWSYHPYYSPAYCATLRYGDYFVWSPLNRYHRPVHYGFDFYSVGGFQFSFHASTFTHANHLLHGHFGRHYVHGFGRHHITNIHADNVFIWNIFTPGTGHYDRYRDRLFQDPSLRLRDYSPRRVVRGPTNLDSSTVRAAERAASLEQTRTRTRFDAQPARGVSRQETPLSASERRASVRSANVSRDAVLDTSVRTRQATRSSREARDLVSRRSGEVRTLTNDDARPGDRVQSVRSGTPLTVLPQSRTSARTSTERGATPSERIAPDRAGTPPREAVTSPRAGVPDARTAPGRTVEPDTSRIAPRTTRSAEPSTPRSERIETPRFETIQPSPRTTRETAPSTSRVTPSRPEVRSTPPSSSRVETPSTSRIAPRSAPSQPRQVAPSSPRQSVPSVRSAPTPSQPRQVAPSSPRQSAPSVRSAPAPSRQSAPSVRSAPSPSRQPSLDRGSSRIQSRSTAPSFSAPSSRSTGPSISSPSSSRSQNLSAPSGRSSVRSFSAPSRSSAVSPRTSTRSSGRSFSAPRTTSPNAGASTSRMSPRGRR